MSKALPLLAILVLLSGCGGIIDKYFIPVADDTVQEMYEAGLDAMQSKEYRTAGEYFLKIKEEFPFSSYVTEAELNLGDALYLNEQYLEAADAYREFEELHPGHEAIPYVLLQVARSIRKTYNSIDKSTKELEVGLEYASRVIAEYPGTEYALEAEIEFDQMKLFIAQRELYIAQIYQKMDNYEAAWNRYVRIMNEYPDIPEVYEYAKQQGDISYLKFREHASEEVREKRVGSWKNWFKWL